MRYLICTLTGMVGGFLLGLGVMEDTWQRLAVKHGVAEFYLDEKHERQWRWKDAK